MSRAIKFRAWLKPRWDDDYDANKMYYDIQNSYDTLGDVKPYDIMGSFDQWLDDDVAIVEQYTGLKDKNGKEIYEGDIVEWVNGLGEKHIFEIIWNECRASFQMVEIGQEYPYILQGLSDKMKPYCEVIGNIHEHQELLGGEGDEI